MAIKGSMKMLYQGDYSSSVLKYNANDWDIVVIALQVEVQWHCGR